MSAAAVSRRDLFCFFVRAVRPAPVAKVDPPAAPPKVALIQGRHCIALTSFCSVCVERCPVAGAITTERGLPKINPELCNGCGICHEICPAPNKAVLMLPKRKRL